MPQHAVRGAFFKQCSIRGAFRNADTCSFFKSCSVRGAFRNADTCSFFKSSSINDPFVFYRPFDFHHAIEFAGMVSR